MLNYITGIMAGVAIGMLVMAGIVTIKHNTDNSCNAPCTIHFDQHSQEDDVFWDWRHNKTVYVYKGQH